jgi:cellulose synthase/poly-beta-1,6-N-acetylglucosamine synthase-like glycosyltransferase
MGPEMLTYPFIFLALYFESFMLVTFLSKPARERRLAAENTALSTLTPEVAIIVSVWNEETTIGGTIESLLALDYPQDKLSLILVNDGSTDGTADVIDRFATHPQITALHNEHAGKYAAMNVGIEHAKDAELIGFLDADSFVASDALREVVGAFADATISAVTASMSIHKPRTLFQRMQYAEYSLSITLRHVFASIDSLYVTPGPFSFYRRSVFTEIGLFKHAYLAEDMEMAMRMQRAGMRIGNAIRARVYTKGPPTFAKLLKQRIRWTTGFMRNVLFDYRDLIGNKKNATLGMLVLPLGLVAIGAGILLFITSLTQITRQGLHMLALAQTVPLSYTFSLQPLTWFYLPITMTTLLAATLMFSIFSWMIIGKYISKTPGTLAFNVLVYLALYGLVTPIWLMYSVSDVARGIPTTWR